MQVEITALISICTAILGAVFGYMSQMRSRKEEIESDAAEQAVISTKLDSIMATLSEIKFEQKSTSIEIKAINNRLTIVEQDLKAAWNQIDELKKTV